MYEESPHIAVELDFPCKKSFGTNANDDSSTLAYGFGYNECQDDYKIVQIMGSRRENRFGEFEDLNDVRIYSLRSNSWQRILENFPGVFFRNHAKFVNGRLHWFSTRFMDNFFSRFVASLNLEDDIYEEVALPDLDDGNVGELGTLGGNLCVSGNVGVMDQERFKASSDSDSGS
ncbi:PREDICTED: F-box/kelch-repeat protein At3g23880-like [Nicotiana attenuata]|uniref:F-box/kelch-repeat protein At3g23880-like n=1 Tax=Nicotiana attenuata TaxID=49451 RepID=UPI000904D4C4|nr:PREDICTED: F-box/kelch-repeat protein At3g23880-like [Nicotiana attenuata]